MCPRQYLRLAALLHQRQAAEALREAAALGQLVPNECMEAPMARDGVAAFASDLDMPMELRALLCELPFHDGESARG